MQPAAVSGDLVTGDAAPIPSEPLPDFRRPLATPLARLVPTSLLIGLSFRAYDRLVSAKIDHTLHIDLAFDWLRKGIPLPHPLYHACLLILSGGNPQAAPLAAAFLLAFATGLRTWLTASYLSNARRLGPVALTLLCLALALAMPLPNWWKFPAIYLGQICPNVWHSSTAVFTTPLALWSFLIGMRTLENGRPRTALAAGCLIALSGLAKPNYAIAFAPCFFILLAMTSFRRVRAGQLTRHQAAILFLAVFGPPTLLLGWQGFRLFLSKDHLGGVPIYAPMVVWEHYSSNHVYGSFAVSTAFPLLVPVLFPRAANADRSLALAWSTFAVAIVQFCCFAERGPRMIHGNLVWGSSLALHVLFVASCEFVLRQPPAPVRKGVALACLTLHAASGSICLYRSLGDPANMIFF